MSSDELLEPAGSPVDVTTLITAVNNLDATGSDTALIDQIKSLEHLKSSCAAAHATLTHAFTTGQHADGAAHHVPTDLTRRSIAGQIALARHESRHRGGRLVARAGALLTDTPQLLAALRAGQLSERRADLIITEFACLTPRTASSPTPNLRRRTCGLSHDSIFGGEPRAGPLDAGEFVLSVGVGGHEHRNGPSPIGRYTLSRRTEPFRTGTATSRSLTM